MIKNIMIKGTGISIIWKPFLVLFGMMMVLFVIAVKKFKISLEMMDAGVGCWSFSSITLHQDSQQN